MRNGRNIGLFALCVFLLSAVHIAAQDYLRLTERDLQGTARYVGMSGAMTAIGGDPSAVRDNPAGLGLYRRAEVTLTMDYAFNRNRQVGGNLLKTGHFSVPQAAVVFSFGNPYITQGIVAHNIMFSYHRHRTYDESFDAVGGSAPSLGALMAMRGVNIRTAYPDERTNSANSLRLDESGMMNEFAFHWAMNISNKWYVGLGIEAVSFTVRSTGDYYEQFETRNADSIAFSLQNKTSLLHTGMGCKFSTGVIYRPSQWFRFGFSIETPSFGSLRSSSSGTFVAQTDSLRSSYSPYLNGPASDFHLPLRTSISAALQVYDHALLAFQYDYSHQQDMYDTHTLRAGIEVVPVRGLYINAGYAFALLRDRKRAIGDTERPIEIDHSFLRRDAYFQYWQRAHYASVGLGFRGKHVIIQAAYQYRWQNRNLYAHENAISTPYRMNTDVHRIVFTLGWHRAHAW